MVLSLLGLPESDFPRMLKLTQELFGGDDAEFRRGTTLEEQLQVLLDFFGCFGALTGSRRDHPTEDLASAIADAHIDGEPLSDVDTASYYVIIASAGHDTISATIAGGLRALIENPDQRQRLTDNPALMPLGDPGQGVHAHHDEEVFDEPFRFDVGRDPNKHLAFRHGVHFCLGAALARMEVSSFFTELLPRLDSIERNGKPELIATTLVGGLKHLPIRYSLR